MKIMVSGLHPEINQEMLSKIFKPYGGLDHVELMKDVSGESKGYGFVFVSKPLMCGMIYSFLDMFLTTALSSSILNEVFFTGLSGLIEKSLS